MADFVEVPAARLQTEVLQALLEEYASRDGTDYGEQETSLDRKVSQLRAQLQCGDARIVYDAGSELWDILPRENVQELWANETSGDLDEG